jgi:hypothetical protein
VSPPIESDLELGAERERRAQLMRYNPYYGLIRITTGDSNSTLSASRSVDVETSHR